MFIKKKNRKVILGVILSFLVLIALSLYISYHIANSSEVNQNNFKVHMNSDNKTLVLDRAYRDLSSDGLSIDCPDTLTLPSSLKYKGKKYQVTAIGDGFVLPDNVRTLIIPEGIKSIGESFCCGGNRLNISRLESVKIPDSVETIGISAFTGSTKLHLIHIPSNLKIIPIDCFASTSITNAYIPEGVTSIEPGAFTNCPLTNIYISSTVKNISGLAFQSGKKNYLTVESIKISPKNNYFKNVKGGLLSKDGTDFYKLFCSEKTYTVPQTVRKLEPYAFTGITNADKVILQKGIKTIGKYSFIASQITSVEIPTTVTKIDDYAFANTRIKNLTLSNGLKTIGDHAFEQTSLSRLSSITIPATVETIGYDALHQEGGQLKVVFKGKKPPSIAEQSESAFDGGTIFTAYVPKGCMETYKKELIDHYEKWKIVAIQ